MQAATCRHKLSVQHCTLGADSKASNTVRLSLWACRLVQNVEYLCGCVGEHLICVYKKGGVEEKTKKGRERQLSLFEPKNKIQTF